MYLYIYEVWYLKMRENSDKCLFKTDPNCLIQQRPIVSFPASGVTSLFLWLKTWHRVDEPPFLYTAYNVPQMNIEYIF